MANNYTTTHNKHTQQQTKHINRQTNTSKQTKVKPPAKGKGANPVRSQMGTHKLTNESTNGVKRNKQTDIRKHQQG